MSSLPDDLNFVADRSATPERMNRAMDYILARLRAVESITPNLEAIVNEMRSFGVARVAEAITPIRLEVVRIYEELQALLDAADSNTVDELLIARAKAATLAEVFSKAEVRGLVEERALASEVYSRDAADARFAAQAAFEAALGRLVPIGGAAGTVLMRDANGAASWSPPTDRKWELVGSFTPSGKVAQFVNIPERFDDLLMTWQAVDMAVPNGGNIALILGLSSDGNTWEENSGFGAGYLPFNGMMHVINRRGPASAAYLSMSSTFFGPRHIPGGINALRIRGETSSPYNTFVGGTFRLFGR